MLGFNFFKKKLIKIGFDSDFADFCSVFIMVFIFVMFSIRLGMGLHDANISDKCIVKSYSDIIMSPFYAIGCNLNKHRFNQKIN